MSISRSFVGLDRSRCVATEPKTCQIMSVTSSTRQRYVPCRWDASYNSRVCIGNTATTIMEFEEFKPVSQALIRLTYFASSSKTMAFAIVWFCAPRPFPGTQSTLLCDHTNCTVNMTGNVCVRVVLLSVPQRPHHRHHHKGVCRPAELLGDT